MKINLKVTNIIDAEIRKSAENNDYVRVKFQAETDNNEYQKIGVSISPEQWKELKERMNITYDNETNTLKNEWTFDITFDSEGLTKGKNPKPLFQIKNDIFKGSPYSYWYINVGVFIENGILTKTKFQKDYSPLF